MGIPLEDKIRDTILAVRFRRGSDTVDPRYFVDAPTGQCQFEASAASFLAHFIATQLVDSDGEYRQDVSEEELHKYSSEVIAGYLEDQGYTVSAPE